MAAYSENDSWIVEAGGDAVEKKARDGDNSLSSVEKLIYCLWVADYGMRNAGDLDTAADVYAAFQEEAASLAKDLSLNFTHETFSLPKELLEQQYFERFEQVCEEIKKA
jgi:hypothetical protein